MLRTVALSMTMPTPSPDPFVLIVDDHEPSLLNLKKVMAGAGYDCEAAGSAAEALVLCDSRKPILIVTDLSMPRLDGLGLARWMKARYPSIPILLVTGELLEDEALNILGAMFARIFRKPLDVDDFLSIVDEMMPGSSRRSGL